MITPARIDWECCGNLGVVGVDVEDREGVHQALDSGGFLRRQAGITVKLVLPDR